MISSFVIKRSLDKQPEASQNKQFTNYSAANWNKRSLDKQLLDNPGSKLDCSVMGEKPRLIPAANEAAKQ